MLVVILTFFTLIDVKVFPNLKDCAWKYPKIFDVAASYTSLSIPL